MHFIRHFAFALTFLTRIPFAVEIEYDDSLPSKSMSYYPLVGGIIGIILFTVDYLLQQFLPAGVFNVLLLILLVYLTGGLHLDGFIDTADGVFSARKKDKMLEIMHDSLIGAFGAVALVLLLLFKYSLLLELSGGGRAPVLVLMPIISRWFIVFAAYRYPLAVSSKLGKGFNYHLGLKQLFMATVFLMIFTGLVIYFSAFTLLTGLIIFLSCFLFTLIFTRWVINLLGGLTGDIYGALNEIIEVLVLFVYIIIGG
ncbi:MAG: adenosylcobinamide-GDP ribazoletransferase [Halanaerobiales bacterium]